MLVAQLSRTVVDNGGDVAEVVLRALSVLAPALTRAQVTIPMLKHKLGCLVNYNDK